MQVSSEVGRKKEGKRKDGESIYSGELSVFLAAVNVALSTHANIQANRLSSFLNFHILNLINTLKSK